MKGTCYCGVINKSSCTALEDYQCCFVPDKVEEKMVPISMLEKAFNDARSYGNFQSEKILSYNSYTEWFEKNVK